MADAIKPSHTSGNVRSSGKKVVSQSISASASSTAEKAHQAHVAPPEPYWLAHQKNRKEVATSTAG